MSDDKVPFGNVDGKVFYRWLAIIGVGAVVLTAFVVVVSILDPGTKPIVNIIPTESTTATSTPSTQTTSPDAVKQTTSVAAMDAMTIEEFAKLPYADRAAYLFMKVPKLNVASAQDAFDPTIIPGFYWQQMTIEAIGEKEALVGEKMISALSYVVTDGQTGELLSEYREVINNIQNEGGEGVGPGTTYLYKSHGETQTGRGPDGNDIEYTNITFQTTDISTGEAIGPEQTSQVLEIPIRLDDGRTIVAYPQLWSIDGKQSPIAGYPY